MNCSPNAIVAVWAAVGVCATVTTAAWGQAGSVAFYPSEQGESLAYDIDESGSSIVGVVDGADDRGTLWSEGTSSGLAPLLGHWQSESRGLSADGLTAAGWSEGPEGRRAVVWVGGSCVDLDSMPGASWAYDLSRDGTMAVGATGLGGTTRAAAWRRDGAVTTRFVANTPLVSEGLGADAEGQVVVGTLASGAGSRAFLWELTNTHTMLPLCDMAEESAAFGVSPDGSVVVGLARAHRGGLESPAIWIGDGCPQQLPLWRPFQQGIAFASSPLGTAVVGRAEGQELASAVIWARGGIGRDLNELAESRGIALEGWHLEQARAITSDGLGIAGWARLAGESRSAAFRLRLPCPTVLSRPLDSAVCASALVELASCALARGSTTTTWQFSFGPTTNDWTEVVEGVNPLPEGSSFVATGSGLETLVVQLIVSSELREIRFRPVAAGARGVGNGDDIVVSICAGDFDCSGGIDGDDVILFMNRWDSAQTSADFTGDGAVDGDDVIGFFGRWDGGC